MADRTVLPFFHVEMEVIVVRGVGIGAEHGSEYLARFVVGHVQEFRRRVFFRLFGFVRFGLRLLSFVGCANLR